MMKKSDSRFNIKKFIILSSIISLMISLVSGVVLGAISTITVTSPNGGEIWKGTQTISWTTDGTSSDFVDIYYNKGAGNVLIKSFQTATTPFSLSTSPHAIKSSVNVEH